MITASELLSRLEAASRRLVDATAKCEALSMIRPCVSADAALAAREELHATQEVLSVLAEINAARLGMVQG